MKLKSFKKNKKLKKTLLALGLTAILGGGLVAYKSNNLYESDRDVFSVTKQTNEIAFTINGNKYKNTFPTKESGLKVSNVICKDGVTAEWNNELWGLVNINSNNNSEISCNIDFTYEGTLVDYVKMMSNYSDEIVEDDFGNLRYIGKNPNNYVQFNNELWRIIGIMKDIENADGSKSDKVKLIRSESIGKYAFDNYSDTNDWSKSELQKVLNEEAYWNRTNGTCPNEYYAHGSCDFSSTVLQKMPKV